MSQQWQNPMLSVDVVALRAARFEYDMNPESGSTRSDTLALALGERIYEPHLGELALPGVLMRSGETVHDAARRALRTKLGVDSDETRTLRTLGVHDTPGRDVRGPTVSISCLAVIKPGTVGQADWVPLGTSAAAVPELPFDHNAIIGASLAALWSTMWSDPALLCALLGPVFTASRFADLDAALSSVRRDATTIRRDLDALPFTERTAPAAYGRGRPAARWKITDTALAC